MPAPAGKPRPAGRSSGSSRRRRAPPVEHAPADVAAEVTQVCVRWLAAGLIGEPLGDVCGAVGVDATGLHRGDQGVAAVGVVLAVVNGVEFVPVATRYEQKVAERVRPEAS